MKTTSQIIHWIRTEQERLNSVPDRADERVTAALNMLSRIATFIGPESANADRFAIKIIFPDCDWLVYRAATYVDAVALIAEKMRKHKSEGMIGFTLTDTFTSQTFTSTDVLQDVLSFTKSMERDI